MTGGPSSWQKVFSSDPKLGFFALLVVLLIANVALVCWRAVRSPEPLPTTETPYVRSRIVAPAGLFPTEAEKRELARVGAGTEDRG